MGKRRLVLIGCALALASVSPASADGVCVAIDVTRDTLNPDEQAAIRIAIFAALEQEGVTVDRQGARCTGMVTAYSIRLGKKVTMTLDGGGGHTVTYSASSINEADLLVSQLVRSLVTGRAMATGTGVQDRNNVLRDQTAPRRVSARDSRRWAPVLGLGGGMLQLPAIDGRPLQRQTNVAVIDLREWGFLDSERTAFEIRARILIHDYAVFGSTWDWYERGRTTDQPDGGDLGRFWGVMLSPLAVANYELGLGFAGMLGDSTPRPYARAGISSSLLLRFSDPDHRADIGFGPYIGLGFQFNKHVSLSVEANIQRPVIHDLLDSGYGYFLTTTAMLEIRGEPEQPSTFVPRLLPEEEPVPTIRRINE